MGKSAGKAPDYQGAAQQQADSSASNVNAQTMANRPDVMGPFAQQQWTQGPNGQWTLNAGLSGGLGSAAGSLGNQLADATSSGPNPMLFNPVAGGDAARNQAIDSAYGQAASRLNPQWQQRSESMEAQLANQGLNPNSQAYRNSMQQFGQQRNDAYGSALNAAIGQGTEAGNQVFQNNAMSHQMAIADALTQRSAPLQQLGMLHGLTATPQFSQANMADPTQHLGAAQATGDWNAQNAQMQNQLWGSALGGLMGAAGSAVRFSDARLKRSIRRLNGEAFPGVPFATWEWAPGLKGLGPRVGVIAQDLQKAAPQYVHEGPGGFLMVDYGRLLEGVQA